MIVGVDIGTQTLKVCVLDRDLQVRGRAALRYPLNYPQPGWVEQDPRLWELALAPTIAEGLDLYQRNRVDRTARIVEQSTQNRRLFHLPSKDAIREEFSKKNQGEERNRWLYSYNPLTVPLT